MSIYPCEYGHGDVGYAKNGQCLECCRSRARQARADDPDAHRLRKNEWQCMNLYGMTLDQRDALLASQGGGCKLCGRTDCHWGKGFQNVWHIDHVHGTKIVRGILCAACNILVGQIEKNLTLSQEAIKYLESF